MSRPGLCGRTVFLRSSDRRSEPRNDEVDLAFREIKLDEARLLFVVRSERLRLGVQPRCHIPEPLWVGYEDIDVPAYAVAIPPHQHGPASEAPAAFRRTRGHGLIEDRESVAEELFPGPQAFVSHSRARSET